MRIDPKVTLDLMFRVSLLSNLSRNFDVQTVVCQPGAVGGLPTVRLRSKMLPLIRRREEKKELPESFRQTQYSILASRQLISTPQPSFSSGDQSLGIGSYAGQKAFLSHLHRRSIVSAWTLRPMAAG